VFGTSIDVSYSSNSYGEAAAAYLSRTPSLWGLPGVSMANVQRAGGTFSGGKGNLLQLLDIPNRVKEVALGTDSHAVHVTNLEHARKVSSISCQELRSTIFLFRSSIKKGCLDCKRSWLDRGGKSRVRGCKTQKRRDMEDLDPG
jgi:hypothetical protein